MTIMSINHILNNFTPVDSSHIPIGGGFPIFLNVFTPIWGRFSKLTFRFFRWVGSTTNQIPFEPKSLGPLDSCVGRPSQRDRRYSATTRCVQRTSFLRSLTSSALLRGSEIGARKLHVFVSGLTGVNRFSPFI